MTVTVYVALTPLPSFAVMVMTAVPGICPVTIPVLDVTLATAALLDV